VKKAGLTALWLSGLVFSQAIRSSLKFHLSVIGNWFGMPCVRTMHSDKAAAAAAGERARASRSVEISANGAGDNIIDEMLYDCRSTVMDGAHPSYSGVVDCRCGCRST